MNFAHDRDFDDDESTEDDDVRDSDDRDFDDDESTDDDDDRDFDDDESTDDDEDRDSEECRRSSPSRRKIVKWNVLIDLARKIRERKEEKEKREKIVHRMSSVDVESSPETTHNSLETIQKLTRIIVLYSSSFLTKMHSWSNHSSDFDSRIMI